MSLDKTGYQVILFLSHQSTADDASQGNGSMKENHILFF